MGEHTMNGGEITKQPAVGEKGEKTYTCTVCGATEIEELDALTDSNGGSSGESDAAGGSNADATADEGMPIGAVIGIVVGAIALLGAVGFCLYRLVKGKKK